MELFFLLLMGLKGLYSFYAAWVTLKMIKPEDSVVSNFSDKRLRQRMKYHSIMAFLEIIFACLMVFALVSNTETMKYIFVGLLIFFLSAVIDDATALLVHRRELVRRQQTL